MLTSLLYGLCIGLTTNHSEMQKCFRSYSLCVQYVQGKNSKLTNMEAIRVCVRSERAIAK